MGGGGGGGVVPSTVYPFGRRGSAPPPGSAPLLRGSAPAPARHRTSSPICVSAGRASWRRPCPGAAKKKTKIKTGSDTDSSPPGCDINTPGFLTCSKKKKMKTNKVHFHLRNALSMRQTQPPPPPSPHALNGFGKTPHVLSFLSAKLAPPKLPEPAFFSSFDEIIPDVRRHYVNEPKPR